MGPLPRCAHPRAMGPLRAEGRGAPVLGRVERVARDGLAPWWRSVLALPPLPSSRRRRCPSSPQSSPSTLSTSPQSSSSTPSGRGRMAGAACPRRERCEGEAAPCPTLACGQAHLASHQALLAALDALLVVVAACTTWLPAALCTWRLRAVPHDSLAAVFSPRERRQSAMALLTPYVIVPAAASCPASWPSSSSCGCLGGTAAALLGSPHGGHVPPRRTSARAPRRRPRAALLCRALAGLWRRERSGWGEGASSVRRVWAGATVIRCALDPASCRVCQSRDISGGALIEL